MKAKRRFFAASVAAIVIGILLISLSACPQPATPSKTEPADTSASDVVAVKSALELGFASGDTASAVTGNITLPSGSNDVTVTWSSSNTVVVSNTGVVTRPTFADGDATVTLTATLTKNSANDTKSFSVTVKALADPSPADVAAVKSSLAISFADGDTASAVTENITLPSGSNGVNVTWSSSNSAVVSNNGIVTRPSYADGDATVTLTATLTKGTVSDTKSFTVIVKAQAYVPPADTSAEDVAAIKSSLVISFTSGDTASAVTENITLPSGSNGVNVTWSSSNTAVVSNTGVVTRPSYADGDATVTLTATLTKGTASDTKSFTITVKAQAYVPPADTSAEDVAAVKSSLAISFASGDTASAVTGNITLPSGSNGVNVTWSSSNSAVVSNNGIVTRPSYADGDASVTLTATLTKGTASDTKSFTVIVKAVAPYSYTVTFDSQGADTAANPVTLTVTEPATKVASLPGTPEKSGFTFGGWFTEVNGEGTEFTADTVVTSNITVYAKWTEVSASSNDVFYTISGNKIYKNDETSAFFTTTEGDISEFFINSSGDVFYTISGRNKIYKNDETSAFFTTTKGNIYKFFIN